MRCSVIINNFNYAKFLAEAIDSALKQTYEDCEVIVVDDGSTDISVDVIRRYGDRIIPVLKENGGQASAMNSGFLESSGELILFLDADDWLEPNAIKCLVESYQDGVGHMYYALQKRGSSGEDWGIFDLQFKSIDEGTEVWRILLERGAANFPPTSGNAFSRSALEAILPIPEQSFRIRADVYLLYRAAFHGSVVALSEALANYRIHGSNLWFTPGKKNKARTLRKDLQVYRRGMSRAKEKLDLLELEREAKGAEWGARALMRIYRLRWRQLNSLKANPKSHPYPEDDVSVLIESLMQIAQQLGFSSVKRCGLRVSLWILRTLPSQFLGTFVFYNTRA